MKKVAALLLAGALLVTGCGGTKTTTTQTSGSAKEPIRLTVATMSPLSGSLAAIGESVRYGTELALKDRAADLEQVGYKVEFLAMDDQAKPEQGTQLAEQLLSKKDVVALVGPLTSGVTIAVSQKVSSDNLLTISPSSTAVQVTDRRLPNVARIVARDDNQGPAIAKFVHEGLKASNLFVIHDKTTYGQGLAEEVKKTAASINLKVDGYEGITVGDKDFSAVLNKVKVAKSPVIFFGGLHAEAAQLLKQMKEKGIEAKFVGADALDNGDLLKLAGDAAEGVYYTSVAPDISKSAEGQNWIKRYTEFSKKPYDSFAAYSYDAALVVTNALIEYGKANPGKAPSRKEVTELVRKTSGFKGVASAVNFDDKGDNKDAKVFMYQIQNMKHPGTQIQ